MKRRKAPWQRNERIKILAPRDFQVLNKAAVAHFVFAFRPFSSTAKVEYRCYPHVKSTAFRNLRRPKAAEPFVSLPPMSSKPYYVYR